MSEKNLERRRFTRIHFDAKCTLVHQNHVYDIQLVDICLRGALAESTTPLPVQVGDSVELIIALDEQEQQIRMPAEVNHLLKSFVGFRAENMELASITHLRRLVELNLGNPELLERELEHLYSNT